MTDNLKQRLKPEVLRSRDSATFTGSYQTLGAVLVNETRLLKFVNNSTVLVTGSWDGISDHFILPAGSQFILDITTNAGLAGSIFAPQGLQFYIKGSAGTGSVYLECYHT